MGQMSRTLFSLCSTSFIASAPHPGDAVLVGTQGKLVKGPDAAPIETTLPKRKPTVHTPATGSLLETLSSSKNEQSQRRKSSASASRLLKTKRTKASAGKHRDPPVEMDFGSPISLLLEDPESPGKQVTLTTTVAFSHAQHAHGLMYREEPLSMGEGMLFVYPAEGRRVFWMKNTMIPLEATWWSKDGVLQDDGNEMQPQTLDYHWSDTSHVQYGLEVAPNFLEANGLRHPGRVRIANMPEVRAKIEELGARRTGDSGRGRGRVSVTAPESGCSTMGLGLTAASRDRARRVLCGGGETNLEDWLLPLPRKIRGK
mmetsp:Transcript_16333/g.40309  ORF Transcript_16333/g.40309 Transcript_16333/m.40309 type:complete len:314 (+) Transcript_16333:110-1051(+)